MARMVRQRLTCGRVNRNVGRNAAVVNATCGSSITSHFAETPRMRSRAAKSRSRSAYAGPLSKSGGGARSPGAGVIHEDSRIALITRA